MMDDLLRLRTGSVEWRIIDGEILALDLRSSIYLGLNRSGAVLWEDVVGGTTREALVERLMETFAVDAATAERDVAAFLRALDDHDLLESSPE
jgi:Coenzyme PQQ synthesis protein D (PqqD)